MSVIISSRDHRGAAEKDLVYIRLPDGGVTTMFDPEAAAAYLAKPPITVTYQGDNAYVDNHPDHEPIEVSGARLFRLGSR